MADTYMEVCDEARDVRSILEAVNTRLNILRFKLREKSFGFCGREKEEAIDGIDSAIDGVMRACDEIPGAIVFLEAVLLQEYESTIEHRGLDEFQRQQLDDEYYPYINQ